MTANVPTYGFTNNYPTVSLSGTAGKKVLVSISMDNIPVTNKESYYFDINGAVYLRCLGDLFERYFYNQDYAIRKFKKRIQFTFESEGSKLIKESDAYFCRSYVSGEKLTPERIKQMPLSRCSTKHTLADCPEFISFIGTAGLSVSCDIIYISDGQLKNKTVTLFTFPTSDIYYSIKVSASAILQYAGVSNVKDLLTWDVYIPGYSKRIRYILDFSQAFDATVLLYQNCFGGMETFLCRGVRKQEIKSERETATIRGRVIISNQTSLSNFTLNTGALTPELCDSLIDLLSSRNLMSFRGNMAISVIVNSENLSLRNLKNKLPDAELTYSYSDKSLTVYSYNESEKVFDQTFDNSFE